MMRQHVTNVNQIEIILSRWISFACEIEFQNMSVYSFSNLSINILKTLNSRYVPKLNELYVLYLIRVNIAKLACCGSQCIHLKISPRSTSTYKFWWRLPSSIPGEIYLLRRTVAHAGIRQWNAGVGK